MFGVDPEAEAKSDLAGYLGISAGDIKSVSFNFGEWPQGSAGNPKPESTVDVLGSQIILEAQGKQYQYNATSMGEIVRQDEVSQGGFKPK